MRSRWAGLIMSLFVGYFIYHAVMGEQGLGRWSQLQTTLELRKAELAVLEAENAELKARIARLTPGQIDPDYVEYLARRELGFVYSNEIVLVDQNPSDANLHK